MVKVVTFFLIGMLVLAIFGRLRLPGKLSGRRGGAGRRAGGPRLDARKCPRCGRHAIGDGPCDCETADPPKRT